MGIMTVKVAMESEFPHVSPRKSFREGDGVELTGGSFLPLKMMWRQGKMRMIGRGSVSAFLQYAGLLIFCCFIVLLPSSTDASPARHPGTCGPASCKANVGTNREFKFQYKEGGVYNYLYTVNGTIAVDGGPSEQSCLHFSANATIHFLTACDAILYMKDVELWQSVLPSGQDDNHKHHFTKAHTSQTFKESLEQFPLRFSYADGLIEEICPDPKDSAWILNIKRGFLSAFQNTMRRLDLEDKSLEDDVNGHCGVKYRLGEATSSTLTIEKIKDLNSCGDKYGRFSSVQGTAYNFGPLQQSMPAVDSLSECNQVVDRNLIVEVQCMEKHGLKPLSNGASGVYASIIQHLDLITVYVPKNETEENGLVDKENEGDDEFGLDMDDEDDEDSGKSGGKDSDDSDNVENAGSFVIISKPDPYFEGIISRNPEGIWRRESLHFHHEYNAGSTPNDYKSGKDALVKFCRAAKVHVDGNLGELFETLVSILKGLNLADMMHLSREAATLCGGDRSLFDNVLEAIGSAASVGVIKDRISNGDAPSETISSWINSLTFIPKPGLDLMVAALPILRFRDNYPNILLSYSSLAHSFCRENPACLKHQPIQTLGRLYEKFFNLSGCVTKQRKNVDQALMYLKGIGNFGMYNEGIHGALQTCISSNDKSEVRVAAIEAYRRMSCHEAVAGHADLRKIFEDQHEDAEVRIAAFLTIMRCATYSTIRWLKTVMEREEIRQVTSFVSSFINNLQESSLPSKLELQGLVSDEQFNDPYHTDFRQFSKNFELSAIYPDGNFGVSVDSNLIFSQHSYMPRSTSFNLTVDLFGESINVLEGAMRLENFEHYVESIFGPNGKLSSTGIHKLLSTLRRQRRAVPSKRKMRTLALEYDAMRRYYSDPIVSLSLRTLGNEISFSRMVGLDEQLDSLNKLNPLRYLEQLSNTKDSNWQKSTMLFDSSYIIPTGVGLPLNLSAQASSIMRFQAESMIDATNFRANPFQLKLKGKLAPSALVTASATVSLSAFQTHAGMKVRAQLLSSTALEGGFHLNGTELLDVEFGVPKAKQELMEFRSDVLFLNKGEYKSGGKKAPRSKTECNTGLLYKYTGLKLCTTSHFVPPPVQHSPDEDSGESEESPTLRSFSPFLINGPSYLSLTLDKSNPNLVKTRFHYQWKNNETHADFKLRTIKTTGLSVSNQREDELGVQYSLAKQDNSLSLNVNLPTSRIQANGNLNIENSAFQINVTDKGTGRGYMGTSFTFDRVGVSDKTSDDQKGPYMGLSGTYTGTGNMFYKTWKMDLTTQASINSTRLSFECKGSYGGARGSTEKILLQLSATNQEQRRHGQLLGTTTNTDLAVDFTQFPEYNSIFLWKSLISEDGYQNDIDFRQGRNYLTESDPTTFRIRGRAHHESSHERTGVKWMFLATQPSQETDWGVEASFNSHGKSFDSAISFRYAPGQSYGTSISVERKPGVMLFLNLHWNLTIPSRPPMEMLFRLDEHSPRVYQAQHKMNWFGANKLALDIELSDRSRRNKADTTCTLTLSTKTIDNLKLGFHYLSEERETKLQLNSEYQNQRNAFEAGHIVNGARKHKLYGSVTVAEVVYLVMTELDFEHGVQCSIISDLGPEFSDIQIRTKATNQNGLRQLNFDYSWDVSRDSSKQFLLEISLDSSRPTLHRFEGIVSYPGYNYFCEVHHRFDSDDRSRVVMGRLKWKDEEHLHVNAQLVPRISDHEAYDVLLEVATPFELVKNVSFNTGIELFNGRTQCLININGTWGNNENLQATIESLLESLGDMEGAVGTDDGGDGANDIRIPFKYTIQGNMSSTMEGLTTLKLNIHHSQFSKISCKTDLDIQLANEKEISMTNHLVLPESFSDLLSTRIEFHIKTPFAGLQNMDVQAILGRKEDKDVLGMIGIYVENFQYSLVITGTPRFEEDGALGFEMTTSNPKYDKIFGSFSYVIGDNSRLACQLGWPQVVVGLEAGFESSGWEEFQLYLTFTSPWMPVKNINTLAKIDMAQFAEIKLELNEEGMNAKCEWVIESWTFFDIRLGGSTPFAGSRTFGGILKHSWDDPVTYHSQMGGWVEDHRVGYKLEGGTSEKEEECGFSTIRHAQLELDTVVYPTVRTTFNLAQMDIKYNLELSILLREGPINVIAELEVLDVLRFNEKILITTPYPALFELEINLNPAIVLDRKLYNLGLHSKWRTGSTWEEGGVVLRFGAQDVYAGIVAEDLENMAFMECGPPEGDEAEGEGANDYGGGGGDGATDEGRDNTVDIPRSQLFHFYSPLKWASVVKLEYQQVSDSPDSDNDGGSQALHQSSPDDVDQFPLRNFAAVYQGYNNISFSTVFQNEALSRTFTLSIDTPTLEDRLTAELDCSVDLSEVERKINFRAISRHPTQQEYSLTSVWNNQLPQYFSGNVEMNTPIEKLEQQSGSLMYAHNEGESSYTVDLEFMSITFDKLATNVVLRPRHFSMTLNTPLEGYKEVEIRADSKDNEESPSDVRDTFISIKNGEEEVELDLTSQMKDEWPTKIQGTISATFGPPAYRQGTIQATSSKQDEVKVNATGEILWEKNRKVFADIYVDFPVKQGHLQELRLKVNTTIKGPEHWRVEISKSNGGNDGLEYAISGMTPYSSFSTVNGVLSLKHEGNWLDVSMLNVHGNAPNLNLTVETSWNIEKWNDFEVNGKAKYRAVIEDAARNSYEFLKFLPASNSLAISIGNKIPTFSELTSIDSKALIKIQDPYLKAGQNIHIAYVADQEPPTFTLRSSTVSMEDSRDLSMKASFDKLFNNFDGTANYKSTGSSDRIYGVDCKWEKEGKSVDAVGELIWGSEALGAISIHGSFNCSVNESSNGMLHARIGSPVQKLTDSSQPQQQPKPLTEEGTEMPERDANPLVNPLIRIDGTFNKISGQHTARIQFGQDGIGEAPMVTEAKIRFLELNDFDSIVNFTSNIDNFTDVGFRLRHKLIGNVLSGTYGGHWDGDEAMLRHSIKYENTASVFLVDLSLFGVIPVSTESVPRPQRVGIDVLYKGEAISWETVCRGEYNGVQLLKANYKSGAVSSTGIEKRNTQLELDNHFWPYGVNYTYQLEYSGGGGVEDSNLPTKAAHFIDVYNLQHPQKDKIEAELNVERNFTGERIVFQSTHPTRKVQFITAYNSENNMFQHATDFSWKEDSWMGYQLALMDMSKGGETDHKMSVKVNYPIRTIHMDSGYTFKGDELKWTTELNLNASRSPDKIISTVVLSAPPQKDKDIITGKAGVTIQHPALVHDMIAAGELTMVGLTASSSSPGRGRIDGIFSLEYSDDPTQRLILNWDAKLDFHEIVYGNSFAGMKSISASSLPYWEVETKGKLEHLATNLDLKTLYSTQHSQHELSIIIQMDFKNSVKNANQESKMAFELLKDSKEGSLQIIDPEGYALFWSQLTGHYPQFVVNGKCNVTGIFPGPEANISLDLGKPYFRMYAVHGKDLQDGIFGEGGVVDSRNAHFDISESYNGYRYSDVNFYLRLNHSRLITSKLQWRPELFSEIYELCLALYKNSTAAAGAKWDRMCAAVKEDASQSSAELWTQLKPNVAVFMDAIEKDTNFTKDIEAFQTVILQMYNGNELHLQDMHDYVQLVAEEVSARLKKAFERYKREVENPVKFLEKAFAFIVEQFQNMYEQLTTAWRKLVAGGGQGLELTIDKLRQMLYQFLNDALEMAEQVITHIYQNVSNFFAKMYAHLIQIVERYRPSVMAYVHQLEAAVYNIVSKILDIFYETRDAVVRSPYYQRLKKLTEDLDDLYKDIKGNDLETNLKKYCGMTKRFLIRKLKDLRAMNFSLGKIGQKLKTLWEDISQTELFQDLRSSLEATLEKMMFMVQFTEMDVMLRKAFVTLISKGKSIFFMTAIETASRFEEAKTKFYFHPGKGIISLEQKLPMPLAAFNETPNFKELPEYRTVLQAQEFFQSSEHNYWIAYNQFMRNPFDVLPPFEGHAMVASPSYFFTFDGLIYNRTDPCVHLLAADLVDGNFSVSLQYSKESPDEENTEIYNIIVASGHNTLIIDLVENDIKDPKRSLKQGVSLPIQMANLQGYQEAETLIVQSSKGLIVSCNTVYQICQLKVSGWYSRKISGTLGTMDMEPFTDLVTAGRRETKDIGEVFRSWDVADTNGSSCTANSDLDENSRIFNPKSQPSDSTSSNTWCHRVFQSQQSSLQPCFSTVNTNQFLQMCLASMNATANWKTSPSIDECKSAVAYALQCDANGVLSKVPTGCIKCELGGETMTDKDVKVISSPPTGSPSFSSTDIVFIIEAKDCNRALRTKRKTDTLVSALEEELDRKGFKNNRYAAVVYGGDGVFDKPHSIVQNLETFTTPKVIGGFISSIAMGNGNNDTFEAIWYSLHNLDFRPGVSKTLILSPCSSCSPGEMKKDFSTLQYAMLEQDAKLHILMNRGFLFESKNLAKKFFGYDAKFGFTKSDGVKGRLKGDAKIRHQVFLPKRMLGHCAPLALDTNGTIFSAKKMQNRREKVVKLFSTVFSRRVVMTAASSSCQTCYCLPKDRIGIGKVECFVCDYPRYKPPPDDYEDGIIQSEILGSNTDEEDVTEIYDDDDDE